ncbi:homocysteine S-methyltransferase, partial [Clavibacter michiganensis subsp. michiganensis]|nr:homocysteine S-methyltransferase [Clavibacter michiganensis subsp. michiganensis]
AVDAWIRAGASLVGGCCRVGPDEIARMRDALG